MIWRQRLLNCLSFQVVLASGEVIGYDILFFATGSNGKFPVKFDDTIDAEQAVGLLDCMRIWGRKYMNIYFFLLSY